MATTPSYAGTPAHAQALVSAANTNRDGTGTLATVLTAGANGTRIDRVRVVAIGTTTANVVRLFINDGTNIRLLDELIVPAITPSTSLKVFEGEWDFSLPGRLLVLPNGHILLAGTNNSENYIVRAFGGNF